MAVFISLNGNTSGNGFLIAPQFSNYNAELTLWTDTGTATVTLQASPDVASLVFSQTTINISTAPVNVMVHSTLQSNSRDDTTIQVNEGSTVVANFNITSIKHPVINFRGRFEARFATDGSPYNRNPMYTASSGSGSPGPGWTWGLEGEPDFVPTVNNVPENLEDLNMGRVIRLNNPVALRSHSPSVTSVVDSITGDTALGVETFFEGDPIIGQPVNFGTHTYFAGNNPRDPSDAQPEEFWGAAREPLGLFELHFGSMFSGSSQVGPFIAKSTTVNTFTRNPDSRPIANGLPGASAELAEFGLPNLQVFSENRIDLLISDYNALPSGASVQRRNLARRIGHLLSSVSIVKRNAVQTANPGEFTIRVGTLAAGWSNKEVYGGLGDTHAFNDGRVDANLVFLPQGSNVVQFLSQFTAFNFVWEPFAFHSDELCGHHKGFLTVLNSDGTYAGDPHTTTVDGTRYDFQSVGEFTLLKEGKKLEIQVRQAPVATQNPITDAYSGLKSCVSIITAAAVSMGSHSLSLQPVSGTDERGRVQLFIDKKPGKLNNKGVDLNGHHVSAFDANGKTGIRIDHENGTVVLITPHFWNKHKVSYLNVSVTNTKANEGIMGIIPQKSWLPRLRNGKSVGPMPSDLNERYDMLYKVYADSWRISDNSSLFVYAQGSSTATFTDKDWPARQVPCELKPEFVTLGIPVYPGMPIDKAKEICKAVTDDDLNQFCVFDVATTGDEIFAEGYLLQQDLRHCSTFVRIEGNEPPNFKSRELNEENIELKIPKNSLLVTAIVRPLRGAELPRGHVIFYMNGEKYKSPIDLDDRGRANIVISGLAIGENSIRAQYQPDKESKCHPGSSPNLIHKIDKPDVDNTGDGKAEQNGKNWRFWLILVILFLILICLLLLII